MGMKGSANGIVYGLPQPGRGRGPGDGRVCGHPGCLTVLSRYNDESTCWTHAEPTFRTRSAGRHGG